MFDKIVIVTRSTPLEELILRLNSREQARFYLQQNGVAFSEYEQADQTYRRAVEAIERMIPRSIKSQRIERQQLPRFQFGDNDLVITIGQDGLVVNTAKYLTTQPILAINPDPSRFDGVLLPFTVESARKWLPQLLQGNTPTIPISMAKVTLNDGQYLYAVNDLFLGTRSHGSARYQLQLGSRMENQSSSGIIISTGAGCSGWLRSLVVGAWQIAQAFNELGPVPTSEQTALGWSSNQLWYTVREPFISRTSAANLVFGKINADEELIITSHMPDNGVIFSDGVESDFLAFNSGSIAHIGLAERKAYLITPEGQVQQPSAKQKQPIFQQARLID